MFVSVVFGSKVSGSILKHRQRKSYLRIERGWIGAIDDGGWWSSQKGMKAMGESLPVLLRRVAYQDDVLRRWLAGMNLARLRRKVEWSKERSHTGVVKRAIAVRKGRQCTAAVASSIVTVFYMQRRNWYFSGS